MPFVSVPFTTSAIQLADAAVENLTTKWPDWEPNDGDMEVIQIESLALIAQAAVETAADVPDGVFRQYGLQLLGEPYQEGGPAIGTATFTAIDTAGHMSPDVVEIALGGMSFTTADPITIAPGDMSVDAPVTAMESGTAGNELSGAADPITALPWLDLIAITVPTSGGTEPEDDADYQNRISDRLILQSTTLVTARDYELMALQVAGVGRAVAIGDQARNVTVALTDAAGEAVAQTIKDDVTALYSDYRQVNTAYALIDPTYTTIKVTAALVSVDKNTAADVDARATAALQDWLSPANWGRPRGLGTEDLPAVWVNETVVRYSELLRTLSVDGVRYVQAATLNGGTVDVNLTGTAPLTRYDPTSTVTAT